jgi:hypothetical protein
VVRELIPARATPSYHTRGWLKLPTPPSEVREDGYFGMRYLYLAGPTAQEVWNGIVRGQAREARCKRIAMPSPDLW